MLCALPTPGIGIDALEVVVEQEPEVGIVVAANPDVDAGTRSRQRTRPYSAAFERRPGDLQQHALLRIHLVCLAWGNAEELGVEPIDFVDESGPASIQFTGSTDDGIVELVDVPATGGRLEDGALGLNEEVPERFGIRRLGQPAAQSDDGNRIPSRRRSRPSGQPDHRSQDSGPEFLSRDSSKRESAAARGPTIARGRPSESWPRANRGQTRRTDAAGRPGGAPVAACRRCGQSANLRFGAR